MSKENKCTPEFKCSGFKNCKYYWKAHDENCRYFYMGRDGCTNKTAQLAAAKQFIKDNEDAEV